MSVLKRAHSWVPLAQGVYCTSCRRVARNKSAAHSAVHMPCVWFETRLRDPGLVYPSHLLVAGVGGSLVYFL